LIYQWSRRNLTVLGRVTVVKSLLLSKLTHLILTLPDPPQEFIKDLNQIIYKFIWKGIDKVSRNQMIQDYDQGGVRMVDVESYIQALKSTWIRRIINNAETEWVYLFCKTTNIERVQDIEGGSMKILHCMGQKNHKPNQFWKDVFSAWSSFCSCHKPTTRNEILKTSLWYNENIKVGKQSLYYRHWVRNGVDLVNDLLNERGEFFSFEEFINKFNVHTNFVEYRGVISAIKKAFPKMFDNPGDTLVYPTIPFNFDILYKDKKGSRRMYDIIVSRKLQVRNMLIHGKA